MRWQDGGEVGGSSAMKSPAAYRGLSTRRSDALFLGTAPKPEGEITDSNPGPT